MCGIFGIINHHKRLLDKRAFITLGCANDNRGGDACGIMIDGLVEKGTDKENKYFQTWFKYSSVLNATEKCYVALGHCRKASVGGVTADKAQPVTIYDGDKLAFCVIHNGTIYNYEELAKKYIPDVDIKGLSDSQVMAQIFYNAGYDVLQEYEGGGAFVIQDYRCNKTLIFRGKSKMSYSVKEPTEERPLYFVYTGKSVIFSSIYEVLQGLYWGFDVYDMPSNTLLECDGKDLYVVKEYDRSECYGYKVTKYKKEADCKDYFNYAYGYYSGYNDFSRLNGDYSYKSSYSKISFNIKQGLYYNEELRVVLHGVVNVTTLGRIVTYESSLNTKYYFWGGLMLSGKNAFKALYEFAKDKNHSHKQVTKLARMLSCNPIAINEKYYIYENNGEKIPAYDSYIFPLTDIEVVFNNFGKVIGTYQEKNIYKFVPVHLSTESVKKIVDYVEKGIQ